LEPVEGIYNSGLAMEVSIKKVDMRLRTFSFTKVYVSDEDEVKASMDQSSLKFPNG
jgi:hypothetical protein